MDAHAVTATAADPDGVSRVERVGVEFIPDAERDSTPGNLFAVFAGVNLGWVCAIFGWLGVVFGLDFTGSVTANLVGTVLGTLVVLPLALVGPRTGTNMTVSSGAHFGILGRFIGSGLALVFALVFAAITVWTSGDAIVAASHRLLGTPEGDGALALAYAAVSVLMVAVALYGHDLIVRVQRMIVPIASVVLLAGFVAYSGNFDPHRTLGDYPTGGYWSTWTLVVVLAAAGPISYGPALGDYTRRISRRHRDARIASALGVGLLLGTMLPVVLGAYAAAAFVAPTDSFLHDLVATAPSWYVIPILVLSLLGGFGQGVMCIYASGLDIESVCPRLSRVHTTVLAAVIAVVLLFVGVFVFDAADSVTTMSVALNAIATPWVVVLVIGFFRQGRHYYDPVDLQAFAHGGRGRYWFTRGWNIPAVLSWLAGSVFGVLSVNTDLVAGPLADIAGGIDVSAVGSGLVAALVYLAAGIVAPRLVDAPLHRPADADPAQGLQARSPALATA
jgi:purine-cytosine permease-like protein